MLERGREADDELFGMVQWVGRGAIYRIRMKPTSAMLSYTIKTKTKRNVDDVKMSM